MPTYKNIIIKYVTIKNYYYSMNNKLSVIVTTYKYIYFLHVHKLNEFKNVNELLSLNKIKVFINKKQQS